ncbi:MAG: secretin N-terminal domain-containing protein [Limisphaerales bacterium]
MKKLILKIMTVCVAGLSVPALAQNLPDASSGVGADSAAAPASTMAAPIQPIAPDQNAVSAPEQSPSLAGASPDALRLNFQNAPLQTVLQYLSDAAGFIIILDTPVRGSVSVISDHPLTRDQAVDLLNSVLNQNGLAAIRGGSDNQTLTIVDKNDAKTRNIPVLVGNDPKAIPSDDQIVTQIIPIRYVDASQLISDLSSFISADATVVANQAGNSIVITDTQENIHHLMEIIEAIDSSAAGETDVKVFPLKYANPNDVATELGSIFPSGNTGGGGQLPIRVGGAGGRGGGGFGGFGGGGFGGFGGFGGGGRGGGLGGLFGGGGAAGGNSSNDRAQKASDVSATADSRTQSVIVMASKDLMPEIAGMIDQLDIPSPRDKHVFTIHLDHADTQAALTALQTVFPSTGNTANNNTSQNSALYERAVNNATVVEQNSSSMGQISGNGSSGTGGGGSVP